MKVFYSRTCEAQVNHQPLHHCTTRAENLILIISIWVVGLLDLLILVDAFLELQNTRCTGS